MNIKACPRCSRTLDVAEFNWRNLARGRLQPFCRTCSRAYFRGYYAQHRAKYVLRSKHKNAAERHDNQERVLEFLRAHPCIDCGEADPVVLQFDHQNPESKSLNVGELLRRRASWARIQAEIDKCDVRCANDHQRRTARQFGWYRLR